MQNPTQDKPRDRPTPHIDAAHKQLVDTLRLKQEMDADKRASFRLADMAQTGTPNSQQDLQRAKNAVDERVAARADSLRAARKPKGRSAG